MTWYLKGKLILITLYTLLPPDICFLIKRNLNFLVATFEIDGIIMSRNLYIQATIYSFPMSMEQSYFLEVFYFPKRSNPFLVTKYWFRAWYQMKSVLDLWGFRMGQVIMITISLRRFNPKQNHQEVMKSFILFSSCGWKVTWWRSEWGD